MQLGRDKAIARIISLLKVAPGQGVVKVAGRWGSFARLLAVYICKELARPILYICAHLDDADNAADDLQTFAAEFSPSKIENIYPLPTWEGQEELADATDETRAARLKLVSIISSLRERETDNKSTFIIPASIQAICQPIPKPQALAESCLHLEVNKVISLPTVIKWLVENGFERVETIDLPGQFAHRGGIIDIYAPVTMEKVLANQNQPSLSPKDNQSPLAGFQAVRIEFFGDTIDSIRQINLDTYRSSQQIASIKVISPLCGTNLQDQQLFLNILPRDTIVILEEPASIEEVAKIFLERTEQANQLYSWNDIYNELKRFAQLHICRFITSSEGNFIRIDVRSIAQFQHKATSLWEGHKKALSELVEQAEQGKQVLLYCSNPGQINRVKEIIASDGKVIPPNFKLLLGFVHQGFILPSLNTIVISHHELFGQYALHRPARPIGHPAPVDTLADLQPGDYVVHALYGIGKFRGIKAIPEKDGINEYLTIEYADGAKIQVSVRNIALVQKYIGTSPKRPKLSKIGSKKWQKQKQKVAKAVHNLASELLEIAAKRQAMGGIAFPEDSAWQMEFEQSFPYQETPDQTQASQQIKADMTQPIAMDRLLCGDVGYGKTELAMRAAFKAVENGKQVAVLVPTTVLSVQHGRTFMERFADFPVCIEVLNRFKTPSQAKDIIERTKQGKVDILIGTHRLLSDDIAFKDLGLLIIDEEQRFGVEHKEKLKKLRVNVDVLTMTATPIPRTLHMSLLGLRDISSLATPPLDRRNIITTVTPYNKELIRKGIIHELNRQGQVFFLHNRVKTIEEKAWEIQKLVSDAKVAIAHGQMPKNQLEDTMIDFVMGKIDVLVCTTIIGSGLDIPNANTIFINDADRFGLAELHQLRGRVGRYKHRAYAYMLLPVSRPITPLAARRLKAIEQYSHLGAGFKIALRDLEIRGAGNILGPEQSGHIQTVGYQMYCQLLAEAVKRLKNEPIEPLPTAVIDLGFASWIPKNYIPSDRNRLEVYRKIAVARTTEDLKQIESELTDVYGHPPKPVKTLLQIASLRILASKWNIKSIVTSGQNLVFSFEKDPPKQASSLFKLASGEVRIIDPQTVYLHLPKNYFQQDTLIAILQKIFRTGYSDTV